MPTIPWVKLDVLPRLTDKLARSLAGGPCVHMAKFQIGYGWISGVCPNFTLETPPFDANAVPTPIYTGTFSAQSLAFDGGKVVAKCLIPKAAVSEPKYVSALAILGSDGEAIAAGSFMPGAITPDGEFEFICVLEMQYAKGV